MKTKNIFAIASAVIIVALLIFGVIDFETLKSESATIAGWLTAVYVWLTKNESDKENERLRKIIDKK